MEPKVIEPSVELFFDKSGKDIARSIEEYGRTCYKSEFKIRDKSYVPFLTGALKRGHYSIIEHEKVTARIICDRGVTHEMVRHRLGSYSQESTRYVNYKEGIVVIKPIFWEEDIPEYNAWYGAMCSINNVYGRLIKAGCKPEEARSVLPNSLKTEIVVTYNMREWRHFFWLRTSKGAHPQIRQVAIMALKQMQEEVPVLFDDFKINETSLTAATETLPAS